MEFEQLRDIDGISRWSELREIDSQTEIPLLVGRELKDCLGVTRFRQGSALTDERCYCFTQNGKRFILKTLPIEHYDEIRRISEYNYMLFQEANIPCALPTEVGACNSDCLVYSVYSLPDGISADDFARRLSTTEQFELGVKAGRLLHKIHLVTPPPKEIKGDFDDLLKKKLLSLSAQADDELFEGARQAAQYIEDTLSLVSQRPQVALHGAFCLRNLYVDKSGAIGLLPLETAAWGDPVCDFAPMSENFSYSFMRGQLKGYFPDAVPNDFFSLMALYAAAYAIRTALFSRDGSLNESGYGKWRAQRVAKDFDSFSCKLPAWY